jgi:hypothetical protein
MNNSNNSSSFINQIFQSAAGKNQNIPNSFSSSNPELLLTAQPNLTLNDPQNNFMNMLHRAPTGQLPQAGNNFPNYPNNNNHNNNHHSNQVLNIPNFPNLSQNNNNNNNNINPLMSMMMNPMLNMMNPMAAMFSSPAVIQQQQLQALMLQMAMGNNLMGGALPNNNNINNNGTKSLEDIKLALLQADSFTMIYVNLISSVTGLNADLVKGKIISSILNAAKQLEQPSPNKKGDNNDDEEMGSDDEEEQEKGEIQSEEEDEDSEKSNDKDEQDEIVALPSSQNSNHTFKNNNFQPQDANQQTNLLLSQLNGFSSLQQQQHQLQQQQLLQQRQRQQQQQLQSSQSMSSLPTQQNNHNNNFFSVPSSHYPNHLMSGAAPVKNELFSAKQQPQQKNNKRRRDNDDEENEEENDFDNSQFLATQTKKGKRPLIPPPPPVDYEARLHPEAYVAAKQQKQQQLQQQAVHQMTSVQQQRGGGGGRSAEEEMNEILKNMRSRISLPFQSQQSSSSAVPHLSLFPPSAVSPPGSQNPLDIAKYNASSNHNEFDEEENDYDEEERETTTATPKTECNEKALLKKFRGKKVSFYAWDGLLIEQLRNFDHPKQVYVPNLHEYLQFFTSRQLLNEYEYRIIEKIVYNKEIENMIDSFKTYAMAHNKKNDFAYKLAFGWDYLKEQLRAGRTQMLNSVYWATFVTYLYSHTNYQKYKIGMEEFREKYLQFETTPATTTNTSSEAITRSNSSKKPSVHVITGSTNSPAEEEEQQQQQAVEGEAEEDDQELESLGDPEEELEEEQEEEKQTNKKKKSKKDKNNNKNNNAVNNGQQMAGISYGPYHYIPSVLFGNIDELEIRRLLQFRNILNVAFTIIPPMRNEVLLLKIAAVFERSGHKYQISKSGQTMITTRRRYIFRQESIAYEANRKFFK